MSVSMCAGGEVYVHVSELTGMADLQRRVGGRPRGSCTLPVRGLLSTPGQDVGIVPLRTAGGGLQEPGEQVPRQANRGYMSTL